MIKRKFSKRLNKSAWWLDITLPSGQRIQRLLETKAEAEAIDSLYRRNAVIEKYDLPVGTAERPTLVELIAKRKVTLEQNGINRVERARTKRVLADLVDVLPKGIKVDELTRKLVQLYVDKRFLDKVSAQTIDRELNIIGAMLNTAEHHYDDLASWRPPKMPRPKIRGGRRERIWNEREIEAILDQLERPKQIGEDNQMVPARHRVAQVVRFCLLTGMRPGEVARIKVCDVDWSNRKIRVSDGKNGGRIKMVGPLGDAGIGILETFADKRAGAADFIFFQGSNIPPKFYRTLREACERAGIQYGRRTAGGVTLYDARHTATTAMLEAGVSPAAVKEWMGWSESAFVMYYSHGTDKSREQAGQALEGLVGRRKLRIAS